MSRTAIVLFNLGGPDKPEAVEPFLFNLFNDPAIIGLPLPLRWLVAKLISRRRAPIAREIYAKLGGGSPLLPETQAQASALEAALADLGEVRAFPAMRYWHPFAEEVAEDVGDFRPDRIVLLPLYPQFSTTTSASSLRRWHEVAGGLDAPTVTVCCYPTLPGLLNGQVRLIRHAYAEIENKGRPRILFSAHGLPKKVIDKGDPYQWQVEQMAAAIVAGLVADGLAEPDWAVCYQSRVGPLEWIGPSTEAEVDRAGVDGVPIVVVPLAFVSEHSETLVELDIEYRERATEKGVPGFARVPTLSVAEEFIAGLADVVRAAVVRDSAAPACAEPCGGGRLCPARWTGCPARTGVA